MQKFRKLLLFIHYPRNGLLRRIMLPEPDFEPTHGILFSACAKEHQKIQNHRARVGTNPRVAPIIIERKHLRLRQPFPQSILPVRPRSMQNSVPKPELNESRRNFDYSPLYSIRETKSNANEDSEGSRAPIEITTVPFPTSSATVSATSTRSSGA